jgi:hypothetical protein
VARHGGAPCGPWPVQLRFATGLTSAAYVSRQAWREASLPCCPLHPGGGCRFSRHGTYERKRPAGTRIARWFCEDGHCTFSALPDCLAARLSGSLEALEAVVVVLEQAPSLEAGADRVRGDIELPGAIRWARRREQRVHAGLEVVLGVLWPLFAGCAPTVSALRAWLGVAPVLPALRTIAASHLAEIPAPLGFDPRRIGRGGPPRAVRQHDQGPDPPPGAR